MAKLRYIPPNLVTLLSLALGLASILLALRGDLAEAAWFILYSVLLDKVDGSLARLLGAQSQMGVQLDSFADFTAFGLAPFFFLVGVAGPIESIVRPEYLLALLYPFGCVLRLAHFNVSEGDFAGTFRGVPSTHAGAIVGTSALVALAHGVDLEAHVWLVAGCLGALGILMVSPLPLPKIGSARSRFWQILTLANVAGAYVLVAIRVAPEYLCALSLAYLVFGSLAGLRRLASDRASSERGPVAEQG